MRKASIALVFILLAVLTASPVHADKGLIPVSHGVSVYEPGQKAIIAWNGQDEILILSTDVTSSSQTLVLELLPLPSEPKIEPASFQSFAQIQTLIWNEGAATYGRTLNDAKAASLEVVFHEKIGAHEITVVKATDTAELVNWIENFLQANSITETVSLGEFEPAVGDYVGRGFQYYVLDLITVTTEERSVDPILFQFKTSFLYYPLLITSPVPGETKLTLFLLTNGKVESDYYPMEKALYQFIEGFKPIEFVLSKGELSKIDLRIGELFTDMAWLTVLKYDGSLSWVTSDLMIAQDALEPAKSVDVNVEITVPVTLIALSIVLGAACTLAGVIASALITRPKKETAKTAGTR